MVREENLCSFAYMDIPSRKEKKRKKKQTPAGPASADAAVSRIQATASKKKESDKAAVLISLQIMTKKR
jgi:hypothetical protein